MKNLDKAVAIAMNLQTRERNGVMQVEAKPKNWIELAGWALKLDVAEKLIEEHFIDTEYFGKKWAATCDGESASHQHRKTAALMAFCKSKWVRYD